MGRFRDARNFVKKTRKKFSKNTEKALYSVPTGNRPNPKINRMREIARYNVKTEPFPRVMYTRVKYSTRVTLTQTLADVSVANAYRTNSIYDPDYTVGIGSQTCVGHATLATMYDQYWVMGAKIRVSFNDPTVDGGRVGVRLRINGNDSASGESVSNLSGKPLTYMDGLNDSGSQKKVFNLFVRPWSLVGCSKLEYMANSATYASAISSSPAGAADTAMFDVFYVNPRAASANVNANVQITYYVKLYSRKEQTPSTFS